MLFSFERPYFLDEDQIGKCPHSFLGLCKQRFGMSPEQIRSDPEIVGLEHSHQIGKGHLECNSPSYLTLWTAFRLIYFFIVLET